MNMAIMAIDIDLYFRCNAHRFLIDPVLEMHLNSVVTWHLCVCVFFIFIFIFINFIDLVYWSLMLFEKYLRLQLIQMDF
jgi:hypothetical protein